METRKRKHSVAIELDTENPKNWTKEKLLAEIKNIGIKVPSSLKVNDLVKIYTDNKDTRNTVPAGINSALETPPFQQRDSLQRDLLVNSTVVNQTGQSIGQQTPHNTITQTPALQQNVFQTLSDNAHFYTGAGGILTQPGVPAERYRNVEVVSSQLRNQIIAGKDINLALLLIPNNESTSEYRRVDFDGIEYVMKPGDPRLAKSLTLGEFIMAFSKYKNIVCEALPNRRVELDQYERDIVEMATQFGGTRFYDYHKAFSAKAAALLQQHHVKVDWSIRDNNLYCTIFAGMKANNCGLCSSITHSTEFCPMLVNPNFKKGQNQYNTGINLNNPSSSTIKKADRPNASFQGIQLCHNYNERTCYRKQNCKFLHLCYDCHSPHPKSQCKNKPKDKSETHEKKGDETRVEKQNK